MIMSPTKYIIKKSSNRKILSDRYNRRQIMHEGKPFTITAMTPDVILWIKKGYIEKYIEKTEIKKEVEEKKVKKKKGE